MLNMDQLRQEQQRLDNQGKKNTSDKYIQMPDGEGNVAVRILPPKKGSDKLWSVCRTHRLGTKILTSPMQLVNGRWEGYCPIYNHYRKLWADSERMAPEQAEQLRTEARNLKPVEKFYFNAIVRYYQYTSGIVKPTETFVKILAVGKQIHSRILRAILGDPILDEPELGDISDTQTGRDFKIVKRIRKSGNLSFPNYEESKFMQPSKLGTDEEVKLWLNQAYDLDEVIEFKSVEELEKELRIYRGLEQDPATSYSRENTVKPVETVSSNSNGDEVLSEDEFISALQKL